jgi:hypothetical protein
LQLQCGKKIHLFAVTVTYVCDDDEKGRKRLRKEAGDDKAVKRPANEILRTHMHKKKNPEPIVQVCPFPQNQLTEADGSGAWYSFLKENTSAFHVFFFFLPAVVASLHRES